MVRRRPGLRSLCLGLGSASLLAPASSDRWQRHLVGTGNATEMVVSFSTPQACPGCAVRLTSHTAVPPFPTTASTLDPNVAWTCTTLPKPNGSSHPAPTLHFHDAKLTGLAPNAEYTYVVGSDGGGWSPPANFTTADPHVFAIVADFGHQRSAPRTHTALRALTRDRKVDAVIHAGDFAYDFEGEYFKGPFDGSSGDRFMEQIGTYASSVPYFPCPGNHETCHDNYTHYNARFSGTALGDPPHPVSLPARAILTARRCCAGPGQTSGSGTSHWYSWDSGLIHFVALDSEVYENASSKAKPGEVRPVPNHTLEIPQMMRWLEEDLTAANEPATRARVPCKFRANARAQQVG